MRCLRLECFKRVLGELSPGQLQQQPDFKRVKPFGPFFQEQLVRLAVFLSAAPFWVSFIIAKLREGI